MGEVEGRGRLRKRRGVEGQEEGAGGEGGGGWGGEEDQKSGVLREKGGNKPKIYMKKPSDYTGKYQGVGFYSYTFVFNFELFECMNEWFLIWIFNFMW